VKTARIGKDIMQLIQLLGTAKDPLEVIMQSRIELQSYKPELVRDMAELESNRNLIEYVFCNSVRRERIASDSIECATIETGPRRRRVAPGIGSFVQ
jgi:hypothetical protein